MRFSGEDCKRIGEQLKACRLKRGDTQKQLARVLGVTREMVIRYEQGKVAPTGENLARAITYAGGLELPSYKYRLTTEVLKQPIAARAAPSKQLELPLGIPQEFPGTTVRITRREGTIEIVAVIGDPDRR